MPPNKHFNPSAQHTKVQSYLDQLNVEVASILEENSGRLQEISRLQSELNAYKRAYGTIESEREKLEFEKNEIEKRNEDLEARLKGHRVVALIDGDGSIFNNDLLARGHLGGLQAAGHLSNHLTQYLTQNFGTHPYTLWVYVFLNKRGLMHLLMRQGQQDSAKKLEEFVVGFNQAAHRFSMVDVAPGAYDGTIAYLEDETVASQTFKVIFGGCHDNGYVANLRSHITSGFKDKLILLKGYNEMAFGFSELGLPIMTIPGLFVTEKIKNISNGERHPLPNFSLQREFDASSVTSSEEEKAPSRSSEYWQHSPEDVFYSTRSPATTLFDISRNDDIATDIESRLLETTATGPRRGRQVIPKLVELFLISQLTLILISTSSLSTNVRAEPSLSPYND
ncbi:hypothetical protein VKT23_004593 [Stygiomarasmius scandens]|uniref:DUF7923 domain-containing protein n=1 Tax=Marasmiellus scandens TaxID=2682957 RepID=A0ABR1K0C2_9AGAR